jgi:hypothetical protein
MTFFLLSLQLSLTGMQTATIPFLLNSSAKCRLRVAALLLLSGQVLIPKIDLSLASARATIMNMSGK